MTGKRAPPSAGRKTKVLRRAPSRIGTMVWKTRAASMNASTIWPMGWLPQSRNKAEFPAQAGTHSSTAASLDGWVQASAGTVGLFGRGSKHSDNSLHRQEATIARNRLI